MSSPSHSFPADKVFCRKYAILNVHKGALGSFIQTSGWGGTGGCLWEERDEEQPHRLGTVLKGEEPRWLGRSGCGVTSGAWGLKVIPGHLEDELREQMSSRAGGDSRTEV